MSSEREKAYTIEPIRIVFAQNALYLDRVRARNTGEVRTFAVDRIKSLSLTEERFEPVESDEDVFAHSLGVHHGPPEPSRSCSSRRSRPTFASGSGTRRRRSATMPMDAS